MVIFPDHWLIAVRASELDAGDKPKFIRQLNEIFAEEKFIGQQALVRRVNDPAIIRNLRLRHSKSYAAFYYIDESLLRTSRKAGIVLHPLELVFGPVENAEIYAAVTIPIVRDRGVEKHAQPRRRHGAK